VAVTAALIQGLIKARVGDVDPTTGDPTTAGSGVIATHLPVLWEAYADKAQVAPRLQELHVERDAIKLVLAVLRPRVDFSSPLTLGLKEHQQVQTLEGQLQAAEAQIERVELQARRQGVPQVGTLRTVEPVSPPTGTEAIPLTGPNANSPEYTGSPYVAGRS
jgi:hypothetical protein